MESLVLAATTSTPGVRFDAATGLLALSGESYPENSHAFFQPLLSWVSGILSGTGLPVRLDVALTYLNTSSIKSLMDIFDLLEEAHQGGREVAVTWYYDEENDRALEMAEEFREDFTLPFFVVARK